MSDENEVSIQIVAKLDELQSTMTKAVEIIKSSMEQVKDTFDDAKASTSGFMGALKFDVIADAFDKLRQYGREAFDALKEGFEDTAGYATKSTIANAQFAAALGTTLTEASALSEALITVGSSAGEFEQMALRMDMRLRLNEASFRALGVATRDSHGALLNNVDLMRTAFAAMEQYKAGTDQDSFALEVFGRNVSQVFTMMRALNGEAAAKRVQEQMGVDTTNSATQASLALDNSLSDMKLHWDALWMVVGQHVTPVMNELFSYLDKNAGPITQFLIGTFEDLFKAVLYGITIVQEWVDAWMIFYSTVELAAVTAARVANDTLTGDFLQAARDFSAGVDGVAKNVQTRVQGMKDAWSELNKELAMTDKGIQDNPKDKSLIPSGGKNFKSPEEAEKERRVEDEKVQIDEQAAMAAIKIEEDKNDSQLAAGQRSVQEHAAQAQQLEDQRYAIQKWAIEQKMQLDAIDVEAETRDKGAMLALDESHALAEQKLAEETAAKEKQLHDDDTASFMSSMQAQLAEGIKAYDELYKQHNITISEKERAEIQLTNSIYSQEMARENAEVAALTKGTQAYAQELLKRQKLQQDWDKAVKKDQDDAEDEQRKKWQQLTDGIANGFTTAMRGMLTGTETFHQGVLSIIKSLLSSVLDFAQKWLDAWISTQLENLLITKTTNAVSSLGQITSAAGVAGANAVASTAAIPLIGPELAPAAGAAAAASALGFASFLTASRGALLDEDQFVYAHANEAILPANLTSGIQNMIAGGGSSSSPSISFAPQINALDARGVVSILTSRAVLHPFAAAMRDHLNSNPSARPSYR